MLFNSLEFLQFLPLVVLLFFMCKGYARLILLLSASYYFYASWNINYLGLIFISTLIDYFAALVMGAAKRQSRRRMALGLSVLTNLGILFSFKYFNFFGQFMNDLFGPGSFTYNLDVLLPIGISFYTFQTLSYSIDVYQRRISPEPSFVKFALYVSFFPQLVAGPIERAKNILPQLHFKMGPTATQFVEGLRTILWGLFQKIVIADRLAVFSDFVFDSPGYFSGYTLWLALVFFCFQIYFDFASYSNIAIGAGKLFGVDLMKNFNRPYFAANISDFWRRWHISLSTWFRDYVYKPLGGSARGFNISLANLWIVFLVSSLWHGAHYNFLIWGLWHALIISVYRMNKVRGWIKFKFPLVFSQVLTFFVVLLSWLPFRIRDTYEIFQATINLFKFNTQQLMWIFQEGRGIGLILIVLMMLFEFLRKEQSFAEYIACQPRWVRWGVYYLLVVSIMVLGEFSSTPFIYFQF